MTATMIVERVLGKRVQYVVDAADYLRADVTAGSRLVTGIWFAIGNVPIQKQIEIDYEALTITTVLRSDAELINALIEESK